jgi:hypothetical protein
MRPKVSQQQSLLRWGVVFQKTATGCTTTEVELVFEERDLLVCEAYPGDMRRHPFGRPLWIVLAIFLVSGSPTASARVSGSKPPARMWDVGFVRDVETPAVAAQQVVRVPRSIPSDGSRDVTKRLQRFIQSVPDNSRIVFKRHGVYRVDGTITIEHRTGLVFSGRGAQLKAVIWKGTARARSQLRFVGGGNLIVRRLRVKGANPFAGNDDDRAYNPLYEAQHAFNILGVQGMLLDGVRATDTWGDFVYIGPEIPSQGVAIPSRDVTVRDSRFARNGRQGICVCSGEDIMIENNTLRDMRRSVFDIEPPAAWPVHRVSIIGNRTSNHRLNWLANAGYGGDNITDIYFGHNTDDTGRIDVRNSSTTTARENYTFEYNTILTAPHSPRAPFEFRAPFGGPGIINVVVRNNTATFVAGADMAAVSLNNVHTAQVYNNVFTGVGKVLVADASSTDYSEWNNTT